VDLPYEDSTWDLEEEVKALDKKTWKDFEARGVQEDLHLFLRRGD